MVQLIYSGGLLRIKRSVAKANQILQRQEFYEEIRRQPSFSNSTLLPPQIATLMEQASWEIDIEGTFRSIARTRTLTPYLIRVSKFRFIKDLPTAVNALIRETVYAIDWQNGVMEFTYHGGTPVVPQNTAPYVIGAIAESLAKD